MAARLVIFISIFFALSTSAFAQESVRAKTSKQNKPAELSDIESESPNEEAAPVVQRKAVDTDQIRSQSTRFIEHPNAAKGLIKIDKERVYIYRTPESPKEYAASVRIGTFEPTQLGNPDFPDIDYASVYGDSEIPMVSYEMEKPFFRKLGILAYTIGFGFHYAEGTGRYADPTVNPNEPPLEEFSLFTFPISLGATYRLQYWSGQYIVPYVGGGVDLFCFAEYRDDDLNSGIGLAFGAAPAAHAQGGIAIKMGRSARSFLDLDREYGINSMWLVAEFRRYEGLSDNYDFSSDNIGGGIFVEY